ncbi:recombinase family protein [Micavibrio aeruginosavorus]|uniref:Resolvase n=1 Tax=Micavibrio aeruginosavorus EPB TaxID=349215 RepID=M4VHX3_9BACT|nr:recombinase family protein [Micavibrio aeruginosavorus]AGH98972.1 resolvase [Micavibrio aeruginosavorus EPB]
MIGSPSTEKRTLRCAIYTRVSDDEGLDQEFSSLDAQREAGEYHIKAQAHEGWTVLPDRYDDGGYSAKDLQRPAAKRLLRDIEDGKIDVVVVYKIDRLSRNMGDFVDLMKLFDKHKVTFVSVTQHFNTETAMGKLILNILQSFAQFEREMTAERIRDKFAASKVKGMWMGGPVPLGYDVVERKLITNPEEVKLVNHIFERYIDLKSTTLLCDELKRDGHHTKSYISGTGKSVGGRIFTPNVVIALLRQRLYLGEVHHKGKYYPGQHKPIITQELYDKAQEALSDNNNVKRKRTWMIKSKALLKGLIVCGGCEGIMSPTHTRKGHKHYHYYGANSYRRTLCEVCPSNRIPAGEIESVVSSQLKLILASPQIVVETWRNLRTRNPVYQESDLHDAMKSLESIWDSLFPEERKRITCLLIDRIVLRTNGIDIEYRADGFEKIIAHLQKTLNAHQFRRTV